MQKFRVDELHPHPKNDYFFDNMDGEKWTEFLESVKTSGVIEPIIITQDKTIVSGHQRIRACKELGIETVWCEMRSYKNDDDVIKDLLETNIRQRGDVGGSMRKQGLRNKELERLYGVRNGSANVKGVNQYIGDTKNSVDQITQQDLAKQSNQSVDTWNNAKKLAEAIPELDEFIKTGIINTTTAIAIAKKLSPTDQEKLLSSLPTTQKLTQKQVQEYAEKLKEKDNVIAGYEMKLTKVTQLENEISRLKNEIDNRPTIEREVRPADYDSNKKLLSGMKADYSNLENNYQAKIKELNDLKKQIEAENQKTPEEEFSKKLKDNAIFFCARVNDFIEKTGGLVWLSDYINDLPEYERKSYLKAIRMVDAWVQSLLGNTNEILKLE